MNGEIRLEKLLDKVERDLRNFGAEVEEKKIEEDEKSFTVRLGIKGPLYNRERISLCFIRIEINKKSGVETLVNQRYNPVFSDITSFDLPLMSEEEILAEKIRAVRTRSKPRDLYDIYHLLEKDVVIDQELVEKKLEYYGLEHDVEKTVEEAGKLEKNWDSLESLTFGLVVDFDLALETLEEAL